MEVEKSAEEKKIQQPKKTAKQIEMEMRKWEK
jgi:hypothetical protein